MTVVQIVLDRMLIFHKLKQLQSDKTIFGWYGDSDHLSTTRISWTRDIWVNHFMLSDSGVVLC